MRVINEKNLFYNVKLNVIPTSIEGLTPIFLATTPRKGMQNPCSKT